MITKLKGKLAYGNITIDYSVVKTRRRKTSEIIVDKDTIEIRTPYNKPDRILY
jgi:predicted metal-dependent hydrolase